MVSAFSSNLEVTQVVSFTGRFIASFYLTVLFSIFIFLKGALGENFLSAEMEEKEAFI